MGKIGQIPWNKGRKEKRINVLKKLRNSHLGQIAWNKGKKRYWKSSTEFKKGNPKPKNAFKWGKRKQNPNWNGGKTIVGKGYIYISVPNHPFATKKGYVHRSRIVMEKSLGRYLSPKEVVHHRGINFPINSIENRQDNSPENLKLFENHTKHMKFHYAK